VNFNSDDTLKVNVNRLENDNVWNAENRHRIVVPKLAFSPAYFWAGVLFSKPFFQPPNILPISANFCERVEYLSV